MEDALHAYNALTKRFSIDHLIEIANNAECTSRLENVAIKKIMSKMDSLRIELAISLLTHRNQDKSYDIQIKEMCSAEHLKNYDIFIENVMHYPHIPHATLMLANNYFESMCKKIQHTHSTIN